MIASDRQLFAEQQLCQFFGRRKQEVCNKHIRNDTGEICGEEGADHLIEVPAAGGEQKDEIELAEYRKAELINGSLKKQRQQIMTGFFFYTGKQRVLATVCPGHPWDPETDDQPDQICRDEFGKRQRGSPVAVQRLIHNRTLHKRIPKVRDQGRQYKEFFLFTHPFQPETPLRPERTLLQ